MCGSVRWFTLMIILAACRETRSDSGGAGAADDAASSGSIELEDSQPGIEFEARRLIPGVRAQISEIKSPEGATEGNITAFRNGVSTLASAMEADLNRVGAADIGSFSMLSDSVLREIGGGASDPPDLSPEAARQAASQVERLIGIYEEQMRKASN
jgi:hypothetical protein